MPPITGRRRNNLVHQVVTTLRARGRMTPTEISAACNIGARNISSHLGEWVAAGHVRVAVDHPRFRMRVYEAAPTSCVDEPAQGDPAALRRVLDTLAGKNMDRDDIMELLGYDKQRTSDLIDQWMQADWICGSARDYTVGPRWLRDRVNGRIEMPRDSRGGYGTHYR